MKLDVLLTDGDYKNTYAILRALKSEGLKVGILIHKYLSISAFSKLVDKRFFIKVDISENPSNYYAILRNILIKNEISVFLPVGNISYNFAALYKKKLEKYCKVPVVDDQIMSLAQDKSKTFEFARKLGIPIPKTFWLKNNNDLLNIVNQIDYPSVLKKTNYSESGVVYCNNKYELTNAFDEVMAKKREHDSYPIIQEYITGTGTGYYGIYDHGKCMGYLRA